MDIQTLRSYRVTDMALFDFTTSLLAAALIGHYMFRLDSIRSPEPPSSSPGSRSPLSCTSLGDYLRVNARPKRSPEK
jgi:hypothetical protein